MSTTITMDAEGRLLLPEVFRAKLSLREGAKFRADLTGGKIELTPEAEDSIRLIDEGGLLVITGIKGPVDAVAAIQAAREEREESLLSYRSQA